MRRTPLAFVAGATFAIAALGTHAAVGRGDATVVNVRHGAGNPTPTPDATTPGTTPSPDDTPEASETPSASEQPTPDDEATGSTPPTPDASDDHGGDSGPGSDDSGHGGNGDNSGPGGGEDNSGPGGGG